MTRWSVIKILVPWLLLLAATSCGTTNGYNDLAGGGIGGTGISVGKISAARATSVDVNGVAFDINNNTSVTVDGDTGNQDSLKVGMIVKIGGTFNPDGTTGVAASIEFKDNLEGPVDDISRLSNTLAVLGQTVKLDSITYFDDFSDTNGDNLIDVYDVLLGNIVEVSGFVDTSSVIHASYISLKSASFDGIEIELKGIISNLDTSQGTFQIGSLLIDYKSAEFKNMMVDALSNGLYVEVKSSSGATGSVLIAGKIELEDKGHNPDEGDEFEVEGYVTALLTDGKFELEGQIVQINASTRYENGTIVNIADITVDMKLEVKGTVDAYGVLVADKIKIESGDDSDIASEGDSSESDHVEDGEE